MPTGTTELLLVVLAAFGLVMVCVLAAICAVVAYLAGRSNERLIDRLMATDWPSYAGYVLRQERLILGSGYRMPESPQRQALEKPLVTEDEPEGSPDHTPETVARF